MKELRNSYDKENVFDDLNKAKRYYISDLEIPCSEDEYLGDNYEIYCSEWNEYKKELEFAESLEKLAEVLNKYTDIFSDGRNYFVKEF